MKWTPVWQALSVSMLAMWPVAAIAHGAAEAAAAPVVSAADPDAASLLVQAAAPDELYLEVFVNAEATGLILRFTRHGKDGKGLFSSVENLQQLGLDPARVGAPGQAEVALDSLAGLSYAYDAARQSLSLTVSDALRQPYAVSARMARRPPPSQVTPGAVLNYELYSELGQSRRTAIFNDFRYFNSSGVLSSTGTINLGGNERDRMQKYMRYDTFWSHADADTLESWQLGDLISGALSWSRPVRMGGFQWRKNFQLRPDLLTFPVASLDGTALVPSSLNLLINGVQQYSASVPSGPFVLNQVTGINGAGLATVITRDALGRSVATTLPLYVDTRMLASGLSDYSFEIGVLRRDYGTRSFGYESSPVASASGRYGWSDDLTLEGHAEAGKGLLNAGAGALLRLGRSGVINGALSASGGASSGVQASIGYQYLGPRFSIDAQSVRASAGYGDLASRDGSAVTRMADRVSLNLPLQAGQSVNLSYIAYRTPGTETSKIATLGYSTTLFNGIFFNISAFQDLHQRDQRGFYFGLSMAFDNGISLGTNSSRQNDISSRSISAQQSADFGGGFGWAVQAGTAGGLAYRQGQIEYLGNDGRLSARVQNNALGSASAVGAAGALVLMDGHLAMARQVGNGFAMVSTGGVAGVPVLHENREIGVTGRSGYLLVPNLNAYGDNQIAIGTDGLDVDARVPVTNINVVPRSLSGVLANFPVERYSAATVVVHGSDGKPMATGLPVVHVQSDKRTVVGFDGIIFVDDLQADNELRIGDENDTCSVHFSYQRPAQGGLPLLGPLRCVSATSGGGR